MHKERAHTHTQEKEQERVSVVFVFTSFFITVIYKVVTSCFQKVLYTAHQVLAHHARCVTVEDVCVLCHRVYAYIVYRLTG